MSFPMKNKHQVPKKNFSPRLYEMIVTFYSCLLSRLGFFLIMLFTHEQWKDGLHTHTHSHETVVGLKRILKSTLVFCVYRNWRSCVILMKDWKLKLKLKTCELELKWVELNLFRNLSLKQAKTAPNFGFFNEGWWRKT